MSVDPTIGGPVILSGTEIGAASLIETGPQVGGASVVVAGGAAQIADINDAPLDVPVALVRGADGLFRPVPTAITDRPTRTEVAEQISTEITAHAIDPEPHPAYDDIPSLSLLFASRLV